MILNRSSNQRIKPTLSPWHFQKWRAPEKHPFSFMVFMLFSMYSVFDTVVQSKYPHNRYVLVANIYNNLNCGIQQNETFTKQWKQLKKKQAIVFNTRDQTIKTFRLSFKNQENCCSYGNNIEPLSFQLFNVNPLYVWCLNETYIFPSTVFETNYFHIFFSSFELFCP